MKNVVITFISIAAIACGLWLAITGGTGAAATCLSAGVLILLIANINDFEFIKGFGFEARAKKLDDKIREAEGHSYYRLDANPSSPPLRPCRPPRTRGLSSAVHEPLDMERWLFA